MTNDEMLYQSTFFDGENCVHVKEFVELSHLEEEDRVEVFRLQLPPLTLGRLNRDIFKDYRLCKTGSHVRH